MKTLLTPLLLVCVAAAGLSFARPLGAGDPSIARGLFSPEVKARILQQSPLGPPPPDATNPVADDPAAARLGQSLFFDRRLSATGAVSCAHCHRPDRGWADGRPFSHALGDARRHTPTLWNVAYNRWFFWDGRADSMWAQALQPIENPLEQGGSRLAAAHLVHSDPALRAAYERLFGRLPDLSDKRRFPLDARPAPNAPDLPQQKAWAAMSEVDRRDCNSVFANLGKAIAAFERRLVSRRAPFDVFVEGLRTGDPSKLDAISAAAQRGLELFVGKANCRLCHSGPNFTDGEFHDIRVPHRAGGLVPDAGRFNGIRDLLADEFDGAGAYSRDPAAGKRKIAHLTTGSDTWGQFKTPSLRNVARTAPYMHQGQFESLAEVVRYYSTLEQAEEQSHQDGSLLVPLHLSDAEIAALVAFLESLTDEAIDPRLTRPPDSPLLAPAGTGG